MQNNANIIVRKFIPADRERLRKISCDTAFLGEPSNEFFEDNELLADVLTKYFTDYEPDSCFVAVSDNEVIGYLIGSTNVEIMRRISEEKIIFPLIAKVLSRGLLLKRNTSRFLIQMAASFFKGEFKTPDFSKTYPAALHINIEKEFRRQKTGEQLISAYLKFLKEKGIAGVHFGSISEEAKGFFIKMGFKILFIGKRSYFRYRLGKDVPFYIFGKKI